MTPAETTVAALANRSKDEIASWLSRGFLNWALETPFDPFRPHSLFGQYGQWPAEAIEEIYSHSSEDMQDALQLGVEKLGKLCRANCRESARLSPRQRWDLLSEFAGLSSSLICFRSVNTLAQIAIDDAEHWKTEYSDADPYSRCLGALEDIAATFDESAFSARNEAWRARIEESLSSLIVHPQFTADLAPRLFYSLLCISPGRIIEHLELLGGHIAKFYAASEEDAKLAFTTAELVAGKALKQLKDNFPLLKIAEQGSRDTWLVAALFDMNGPLRFHSHAGSFSVLALHREQLKVPFELKNNGFLHNAQLMAHIEKAKVDQADSVAWDVASKRREFANNVTSIDSRLKNKKTTT